MTSQSAPKVKESRKTRNLRVASQVAQMLSTFLPLLIATFSKSESSFNEEDALTVHEIVAEKAWSKLP